MEAELDKRIGCDFKRIPDVLKRLHMHKEELENKAGYLLITMKRYCIVFFFFVLGETFPPPKCKWVKLWVRSTVSEICDCA